MTEIVKGFSFKRLMLGLSFISIGTIAIIFFAATNYVLTISRIVVPKSITYILLGIIVLIGIIVMFTAFKVNLCPSCNRALNYEVGYFSAEDEQLVIQGIEKCEEKTLRELPIIVKANNALTLSLDYCSNCHKYGIINLTKNENYQDNHLIKDKIIDNNEAIIFLQDILEDHENFRVDKKYA